MLTCKQATEAISQAQDRKLGLRERMNLGMHLLMCRGCRAFNRQLAFLHRAGNRLAGNDSEPTDKL